MAATVELSADVLEQAWADPRLANVLLHDWEATTYRASWRIDYDERAVKHARELFAHAVGEQGWPYQRSLEVGCGTGFFSLNLHRAGVLRSGVLTDISPGMVALAQRNADGLGLEMSSQVADATNLPFAEGEFDLVIGHAVLHRVPDVEEAIREALRVLRPGGRFVFCAEPTRTGDAVKSRLGVAAHWSRQMATRLSGTEPNSREDEHSPVAELEVAARVHSFTPAQLRRFARNAGGVDVVTVPERLVQAWWEGPLSALESVPPTNRVARGWSSLAKGSRRLLGALDANIAERIVPAELFADVSVTGTKGAGR